MSRANRKLRGFGLHHSRICLDNLSANDGGATGSQYTQVGGRPGSPVPSDPHSRYLPHIHHAQVDDLTIVALRGGRVGTDTGAGLGYRIATENGPKTRGWNEPNLVLGYRPVDWTTASAWQDVSTVTCPRTQRVVALGRDTAAAQDPTVWVWDPATRTWSEGAEIDAGEFVGDLTGIVRLRESGRILALAIDHSTNMGVVYYSDDEGSSWAEYSRPFFEVEDGTKVRLAQDGVGNILALVVDEGDGDYQQYVSSDSGVTFEHLESDSAWGQDPSLSVTRTGQILVTFLADADDEPYSILLDDAFDLVSGKTPVQVRNVTASACASCADADGILYVLVSEDASDVVSVSRSVDDGASWEGYSYDALFTGGSIADPTDHRHLVRALAPSGGELLALVTSAHIGTTPTTDGSLVSVILGGWSNVESALTLLRRQRLSWCYGPGGQDLDGVFLPTDSLVNQGWAHTGTAETLLNGYHRWAPVAATSYDELEFVGFAADDADVLVEARVESGGSAVSTELEISHRRADGANLTEVSLRLHEDGFVVIDVVAAAELATVAHDMTGGGSGPTGELTQFLLLYGSPTRLTVFYRERGSSAWIEAAQAQLEQLGSAVDQDKLTIGATNTTSGVVQGGLIAFRGNDGIGDDFTFVHGLNDDGAFHSRLESGKAVGASPYPIRDLIDDYGHVAHLSGSGGSARLQEDWNCPAVFDHGVASLDPCLAPSPAGGWESVDNAEQILTWDLQADTWLGSCLFAAFVNCNFPLASIEASTDADPNDWVQIGEYNAFLELGESLAGVPFERQGDLVRPGAGANSDRYYAAGELVGRTIALDPGASPSVRRITWNSAGWWRDSGLQVALRIEGLDGTEPTSGNCYLWASGGVLVMPLEEATAYRRYRLRVEEQETATGTHKLGKFLLGGVSVPGRQWSRGFSVRYIPITREEEDPSGTLFVDARGSEESLSVRREHTVSWQDGYDETAIRAGTAPWLAPSDDALPVSADQDVLGELAGLLRESRGGSIPSVILLEVPAEATTILDPGMWSYGRLRGVLQGNNVQGDEGVSAVTRIEQLIHTELV